MTIQLMKLREMRHISIAYPSQFSRTVELISIDLVIAGTTSCSYYLKDNNGVKILQVILYSSTKSYKSQEKGKRFLSETLLSREQRVNDA